MEKNSTLKQLAAFTRNEKKILESLGLIPLSMQPRQHSVDNILNYSKALSIRKSENFGNLEFLLN